MKEVLRIVSTCNIGVYFSSDKFGTVYIIKYIFENSTLNINAHCNSCEGITCCSSDCILTFLYVDENIHYEMHYFVSRIHFCSVHFTLRPNPQTKL
jgi:hypothetical protein